MKTYVKTIMIALAVLAYAATAQAQETQVQLEVEAEAEVEVSPAPTQSMTPRPGAPLREKIDNRIEQNRDVRNVLLERKAMKENAAAGVPPKDVRPLKAALPAKGTTSLMFKKEARMTLAKKMEVKQFEVRRVALVKELTHALKNLESISRRTADRIQKAEDSGRDMTEAKAALVVANEKITRAKAEVAILASYTIASSTTTNTSTTTEIDLTKPRIVGDNAIKAVKEARDALHKAIVTIARAMGLKEGQERATSTSSTN